VIDQSRLVMHLTCGALPWVTGGREVYAQSLSRELKTLGWNNLVVMHQNAIVKEPVGHHEHEGIPVEVLPPIPVLRREDVYYCRTTEVPGFGELLDQHRPAVVHFQDFSFGANLLHLDEIKKRGIQSVMTIHSPGQSCLQREMLFGGTTPCDGEIKLDRCTACRLKVMGIPNWLSWSLAQLSLPEFGTSRLSRALSARTMTGYFKTAFAEMVQGIDRIHVLSQWVKDVFLRNGVPEEKLKLIRSGLSIAQSQKSEQVQRQQDGTLKLVMVGRCEPIKGQHVLIEAVKQLSASSRVQVMFIGPYWDTSDYGKSCLRQIAGDERFAPPRLVPHREIPSVLHQADALVIPSTWFENAPLVVLEALAYRLPVIGSRLGGIPELVSDGKTGLLFQVGSAAELKTCIQKLHDDRTLLETFRQNIPSPRYMSDVAADTAAIYHELLSNAKG
jgi:glycosyltransferase involved in cell wall biosynthesis